jgi:hypothetical protein
MKDRKALANGSLLLALTTAMAACGSETTSSAGDGGAGGSSAAGTAGGGDEATGGAGGVSAGTGGSTAGAAAGTSGSAGHGSGGAAASGGATASAGRGGAVGSGGSQAAAGATGQGGVMDAGEPDASCPPGYERRGGMCARVTIRRPFLVGSSLRAADVAARGDWSMDVVAPETGLDAATRAHLAAAWLKDALEEHASIAAFARLTMHLLSVGAPPELIVESQRASLDEVRHARACFALASRYAGEGRGPSSLSLEGAFELVSLEEIARLTVEEGCVGETLGAALAREQLAVARDPAVVSALRRIAKDEARHATLAWKFARWAVLRSDDSVRAALFRAAEQAIASTLSTEIRSYDGIDLDALHAHGRLTCAESRAVAERAVREVVMPCLHALVEVPHGGSEASGASGAWHTASMRCPSGSKTNAA